MTTAPPASTTPETRAPASTPQHPPGASLHLGGNAWAAPDLAPLLVPITDVHPYPGNPRRGDQDAITSSIRDHGLYAGCVTQTTTGHILVGNHRFHALHALGATMVPRTPMDVDDTRARAIVARDNLTSDRGGYHEAEHLALLEALAAEDALPLSGYTDDDLDALRRALAPDPEQRTDPDEAPDLPSAPPVSQVGDVWRLGPHRLVVGDATDAAAYDALLDGDGPVACVWTDPPYGVAYLGGSRPRAAIENDGADREALAALLTASLGTAAARCAPGAAWYVAAPHGPMGLAFSTVLDALGVWRHSLVWVKNNATFGRADYHHRHEPVYYGWVPGGPHQSVVDRKQDTVWEIDRPARSVDHPTMKPVELVARALRNSTQPGDLVLDPFGGSGTTLIAAHQEDRTARLIELDPRYADVICRRYQEHTGTLPVRDGTQVDFTTPGG